MDTPRQYYHIDPPAGVKKDFVRRRASKFSLALRTDALAYAVFNKCSESYAMRQLLRKMNRTTTVKVTTTHNNFTNRLMCA